MLVLLLYTAMYSIISFKSHSDYYFQLSQLAQPKINRELP